MAPPTALQPDWVIVYRFDSVAHLQAWINGATRQRVPRCRREYFEARHPAGHQRRHAATDPLVTVVVSHRVHPDNVDDFLAWQRRMSQEEGKFEGFRGTEIFRPIEGVQDEWTTLYRFDNAEHLDAWLTSVKRREILAEGEKFNDYKMRAIDNSFGSWFALRRTARKHRRRPKPRRPSPSGSACTRPSYS